MIKFYQKTVKDQKLKELRKFSVGSWIYVENPSEKELIRLSSQFGLDEYLLKDAIDPNEVPRVEINNNITYVFTRVPYQEEDRIITIPLLVGIAPDFIFTVCCRKLDFWYKFFDSYIEFYTTQKSKFFTQIFSEINEIYNDALTNISRQMRGVSVRVDQIKNEDILRFVIFEEMLNDFMAALIPTNALLNNILSGKFFKLYEEDQDLIENLFLVNRQLIEMCKANLKTIVNVREAYSTIMSNNLNRIIKFFTSLTIVLTIPTIIASFYGMNVLLPFSESHFAFAGITIFTIIICFVVLIIFIKKDWL